MRIVAIAVGCLLLLTASPAFAEDEGESRIPAYVGTGVTGALAIGGVVSYFMYQAKIDAKANKIALSDEQREAWKEADRAAVLWRGRALYLTGATIISGALTGYLWTRAERPRRRVAVTTDGRGGIAWLSGSF